MDTMMKKYFLPLLTALLLAGCYNEGELAPSQLDGIGSKFNFPQGTTQADEIFKRIYEKYGTKVIYKDFTEQDLQRGWVNSAQSSAVVYEYDYITDEADLLEAAMIIEEKILGLFPEETMKKVLRSYPYIYLTDNLHSITQSLVGPVTDYLSIYPIRALDGIGINLQLDHLPKTDAQIEAEIRVANQTVVNNGGVGKTEAQLLADIDTAVKKQKYRFRVYHPLRIAVEFYNQAFYKGWITVSEDFYKKGELGTTLLRSYNRSTEDPAIYDNYWARQGRMPFVSPLNGVPFMSKSWSWQNQIAISPLTGKYIEIPFCLIFLATDRNWRTYDDVKGVPDETLTGIFYDCPLLTNRLQIYYDEMKEQGIDCDKIQRILYETGNVGINTNPW